jgi:cardiolipin-specific phospholipase
VNGGAYFYRNFLGLSQYFTKIYALDQLGWGLSSRPSFSKYFTSAESLLSNTDKESTTNTENLDPKDSDKKNAMVKIAESFYVESLAAWRKVMKIDSMVLAGHSMGGLIAVAYTEKYPQHVHQLILISPVGVPEETPEMIQARYERVTWRFRLYEYLFMYISLGDILRSLPESIGKKWIHDYVLRRLPAITDHKEQAAVSEYLYCNNGLLPGSGEYCLPKLLKPSVFGHLPLIHRIPLLSVQSCSFLYGEVDWMDVNGGLGVDQACIQRKNTNLSAPSIDVYQVSNAGHLLMLENSEEFNNGLILASLCNEAKPMSIVQTWESQQLGLSVNANLPRKLNGER